MTRFYAIKNIVDNKYYNYIYHSFTDLHQNTKLYKTSSNADKNFSQVLKSMYYERQGFYKNKYPECEDFVEENIKHLKVVPVELREV